MGPVQSDSLPPSLLGKTQRMDQLPQFDSLPEIPELGLRHAWDVWGRDDVLGSMNHVTPERVAAAARLVRSGVRVSLDLPLDLPKGGEC